MRMMCSTGIPPSDHRPRVSDRHGQQINSWDLRLIILPPQIYPGGCGHRLYPHPEHRHRWNEVGAT